jgi:hypothetical protein
VAITSPFFLPLGLHVLVITARRASSPPLSDSSSGSRPLALASPAEPVSSSSPVPAFTRRHGDPRCHDDVVAGLNLSGCIQSHSSVPSR